MIATKMLIIFVVVFILGSVVVGIPPMKEGDLTELATMSRLGLFGRAWACQGARSERPFFPASNPSRLRSVSRVQRHVWVIASSVKQVYASWDADRPDDSD